MVYCTSPRNFHGVSSSTICKCHLGIALGSTNKYARAVVLRPWNEPSLQGVRDNDPWDAYGELAIAGDMDELDDGEQWDGTSTLQQHHFTVCSSVFLLHQSHQCLG